MIEQEDEEEVKEEERIKPKYKVMIVRYIIMKVAMKTQQNHAGLC